MYHSFDNLILFWLCLAFFACKSREVNQPQNPVKPEMQEEFAANTSDAGVKQDKASGRTSVLPEVNRVEIVYQNLEGTVIPALVHEKVSGNTFLQYEICRDKDKECLSGEAIEESQALLNLPQGDLKVRWRACFYRETPGDDPVCNTYHEFPVSYQQVSDGNPELRALLQQQSETEDRIRNLSKGVSKAIRAVYTDLNTCQDKSVLKKIGDHQTSLIITLGVRPPASVAEELLLRASSGPLQELARAEKERLRTEKLARERKEYRESLEGKLEEDTIPWLKAVGFAATMAAFFSTVHDASRWHYFLKKQRTIYDGSEEGMYFLKKDPAGSGKFKISNPVNDSLSRLFFIEDPVTREMYLEKPDTEISRKFQTGNGREISQLTVPGDYAFERGYLVQGQHEFYIARKDGKFDLDDGTLKIFEVEGRQLKRKVPDEDVFLRMQHEKHLSDLNRWRPEFDPRKGGVLQNTFGNKFRMFSIFAAASGVVISAFYLQKAFRDETLSLASGPDTTTHSSEVVTKSGNDACHDLFLNLSAFTDQFQSAFGLHLQLLDIKLQISLLI